MAASWQPRRHRVGPALAAGAIQCGLAAMVIWGLAGRPLAPKPDTQFVAITPLKQPAPTPTPAPSQPAESAPAAPPAPKAKAKPIATPRPRIAIASSTPAATVAGQGTQASAGAALAGSGSGAGGQGVGNGAGGGRTYPPVRVAGALSDRDNPRQAGGRGPGGTVAISFRVRDDGGVDSCRVIGSSGQELLDELTCELVEERFRYRPARDETGQPVDYTLRTSFTWGLRLRS